MAMRRAEIQAIECVEVLINLVYMQPLGYDTMTVIFFISCFK